MQTQETITSVDAKVLESLPLDMRREVVEALSGGHETAIEYRREWQYDRQGYCTSQVLDFVYFPNAGRGGVCGGGNTDWTDCGGLDDLADRWANYDERWSN